MKHPAYADFHIHTHLSPCGKPEATAEAMIRRAQEKGLAAIGFTDHVTPQVVPGCAFYDRQRLSLLADLRAEIAEAQMDGAVEVLRTEPVVEVLVGVEADYTLAGQACIDREMLAQADHIICAASHFHLPAAPQPARDTPESKAALMVQMAREALALPGVTIWAHPFDCGRMRPLVSILETVPRDTLAELVDLANAYQVAIEINGGPAQEEDYRQATEPFFRLAHEMEARFTVTADAHHPDDLDRLDLALDWAQEMGIGTDNLLTAAELRSIAEQKRSSK